MKKICRLIRARTDEEKGGTFRWKLFKISVTLISQLPEEEEDLHCWLQFLFSSSLGRTRVSGSIFSSFPSFPFGRLGN